MTTQTTKLGWTDRATFIGLSLTIIGFTWILHAEHRADVRRAEEWYREDKKESEQRWNELSNKNEQKFNDINNKWNELNTKYENRWADLLSKFHDLDKKVK